MINPKILEKMHGWNPWWRGQAFMEPDYRRDPFSDIQEALKEGKVQILAGPRQTGKTTLLRQLLLDLHKNGIQSQNTVYLPLDGFADEFEEGKMKLGDLLKIYAEEIAKQPLAKGEKYIFLDEVHTVPKWNREIKVLYDQQLPLHFVVSGSASAIVLKEASMALAGRSREYVILPLSFSEVCARKFPELQGGSLREARGRIGQGLIHILEGDRRETQNRFHEITRQFSGLAPSLRSELSTYIRRGGFPEVVLKDLSEEASDKHLQTLLDQMIRRDFVEFFGVRDTKTLERTIRIIAQNTAKILSERGLSSDLGVSINTVRNHIGFLEKAFVVFAARVLSGSALSQTRISEKLFFLDSGLRNSLAGFQLQDKGSLLETAVYVHLWSFFQKHRPSVELLYWRRKDDEVDIVLAQGKSLIGIEVHSSSDDVKGLQKFLNEHENAYGLLVSDIDAESLNDKRITTIPPHVFLMSL